MKKILFTFFLLIAFLLKSAAQADYVTADRNRSASIGLTSDAFAAMELGYSQNPGFLKSKKLIGYFRVKIPILLSFKDKSLDSWEFNIGLSSDLFTKGRFGTVGDFQLYIIHHNQILGSFLPVGYKLSLTPCYKFSRGYLGVEIRWSSVIATHIKHSPYVRETFEYNVSGNIPTAWTGPDDGWYSCTGSQLGIGFNGSYKLNKNVDLYGDLGILRFSSPYTGLFDAMMIGQVPIFMNMRVNYKF